jgi:transcriptional regulator GlxA family with amidase domain
MSERSFSRHYAEATGQTPARAIERLRVEAARRLLSELRTPVKRIAQRCGFGSEETMRRSLLRLLARHAARLPRSVHVLNVAWVRLHGQVATEVGFATATTFRDRFSRTVGLSPTAYRNAFGTKTVAMKPSGGKRVRTDNAIE